MIMNQSNTSDLITFGPLRLLIIQATSFCNINCDYCYLPDRQVKKILSLNLIEPIFNNIFASQFLGEDLTVCWHAGEPLTVPISFYDYAIQKINELEHNLNIKKCKLTHSIQTNGTLINQAWCDLIIKHKINISVSLDGPDFIHDTHRKTRTGIGTHASTMRGISLLKRNNIDFVAITVLTKESLSYPDDIFNFFMKNGIRKVGFNTEEIEGVNQSSSLQKEGIEKLYYNFMKRFLELTISSNGTFQLREFERICSLMYTGKRIKKSNLCTPFSIVNIDSNGNFTTFSPELLAMKDNLYGDFLLGNVLHDTFEAVCNTDKFQKIYQDIQAGVELCRETCQYFGLCGGGAPSNKYWENGTFRSGETMTCKYHEKIVIDVISEVLEIAHSH